LAKSERWNWDEDDWEELEEKLRLASATYDSLTWGIITAGMETMAAHRDVRRRRDERARESGSGVI
jgi:hypothetical protein